MKELACSPQLCFASARSDGDGPKRDAVFVRCTGLALPVKRIEQPTPIHTQGYGALLLASPTSSIQSISREKDLQSCKISDRCDRKLDRTRSQSAGYLAVWL